MTWEINANLGRRGRGWLWNIVRDGEVAQVLVEISEAAWSTEPLRLPDDTRHALETDGRTEILKVLDRPDPPRVIHCNSSGCRHLDDQATMG
jgi:hypothetical protein